MRWQPLTVEEALSSGRFFQVEFATVSEVHTVPHGFYDCTNGIHEAADADAVQLKLRYAAFKYLTEEREETRLVRDSSMFRLTLLESPAISENQALIFYFLHVVMDGWSRSVMLRELVQEFQRIDELRSNPNWTLSDLAGSSDRSGTAVQHWSDKHLLTDHREWLTRAPSLQRSDNISHPKLPSSGLDSTSTGCCLRQFDPEFVNLLRANCRKNDVTVTAALEGAFSLSMLQRFPELHRARVCTVLCAYLQQH
jgi:hypothetical protein